MNHQVLTQVPHYKSLRTSYIRLSWILVKVRCWVIMIPMSVTKSKEQVCYTLNKKNRAGWSEFDHGSCFSSFHHHEFYHKCYKKYIFFFNLRFFLNRGDCFKTFNLHQLILVVCNIVLMEGWNTLVFYPFFLIICLLTITYIFFQF